MMTIEDFCRASFLQKRLKMIEEESCRDVFDEIFDRDLRSNSGPRSGSYGATFAALSFAEHY